MFCFSTCNTFQPSCSKRFAMQMRIQSNATFDLFVLLPDDTRTLRAEYPTTANVIVCYVLFIFCGERKKYKYNEKGFSYFLFYKETHVFLFSEQVDDTKGFHQKVADCTYKSQQTIVYFHSGRSWSLGIQVNFVLVTVRLVTSYLSFLHQNLKSIHPKVSFRRLQVIYQSNKVWSASLKF